MKLFDTTLSKLESALNVRIQKQNILNGNLANIDTPGYLPRDLNFEKALALAAAPTPAALPATPTAPSVEGHIALATSGPVAPSIDSAIESPTTMRAGLDGNGVDLDKTMAELSKNALLYGASAKAASKKLAILRYVAGDGVG